MKRDSKRTMKSAATERPPLGVFEPTMDPKQLISLISAAADAVLADITTRNNMRPFSASYFDMFSIERAKEDLGYAKDLFRILDTIPGRRDRAAAYSSLSHTIYGTFAIAQSGVYPLDEKRRSLDLQAAKMRADKGRRAAEQNKMRQFAINKIEKKNGKLPPPKKLLALVNAEIDPPISAATLRRLLEKRRR